MNRIRLCSLAILPLALVACGGGDDGAEVGTDTLAVDTTAMTAPAVSGDSAMPGATGVAAAVMMNAVGSSGLTGQVQFMEHGEGQTMVTVALTGQGDGARSGHVHQGTCDNPGQVVAPLEDVTLAGGTGLSTSTIPLAYTDVMNGEHIVAFHTGAGDNPGAPAVCGQISAQQTGGSTAGTM